MSPRARRFLHLVFISTIAPRAAILAAVATLAYLSRSHAWALMLFAGLCAFCLVIGLVWLVGWLEDQWERAGDDHDDHS